MFGPRASVKLPESKTQAEQRKQEDGGRRGCRGGAWVPVGNRHRGPRSSPGQPELQPQPGPPPPPPPLIVTTPHHVFLNKTVLSLGGSPLHLFLFSAF